MRSFSRIMSLLMIAALVAGMLVVPASAASEITLTNGDFENSTNGWVLTGYSSVGTDSYASNNTTNTLSLWLSDSEATEGSASYTVNLNPGTYYFTFDISGAAMNSGLSYSVTSGGSTLASGSAITTTGWDAWQTVTTAEFTLTAAASVTFSLSGTQTAGYWGNLDNLRLYGDVQQTLSQIGISNGDFENSSNGWLLSGYSTVEANSYAANNATNTLSLWLSDDAEAAGSASYAVTLTAGKYYFTFDISGAEGSSGLAYSVTSGGSTLASGSAITTTGWDVWQTVTTAEFTLSEEASVTFTLSGTQPAAYWGNLDNLCLYGSGALVETAPDAVEAEIYVPYIAGTDGEFMRGMDVSSVLSILNSGASFKDFDGNTLDGQGFFNLLAQTGTNWVRLRVWNEPFDSSGNGYGGGNCDLEAAKTMGQWATNAGLRVLIDFHYSDFWADPGKQQAPKDWASYTVSQKTDAVYSFTKTSVQYLIDSGVDVGMVQVGNETTNGICGVSGWSDMCSLFSAGARAVREVDGDILVAIHFTNPERSGNYANFAAQLNTYSVDYDVFASSYYPYWHGTLSNLTSVLKNVADTYGKQVIVAETSWGFTLEDGDGHSNTVRTGSNDSGDYDFSVQGQADEIAAVAQAVRNVGDAGIGVFYWEPAWIPVQVYDGTQQILNRNKALWEAYGSGWASSYAGEYDPDDAGVWYGGSSWDNQALFDFDGTPLESLKTYQYMQTGTTGFEITVTSIEEPVLTYLVGSTLELPETVTVSYNFGDDRELTVTWSDAEKAAVDMNTAGVYTVSGTLEGGLTTTCTVTVKAENLLSNPGFEESDLSMYTISQAYAKRTTDDPHTGSYSLHFYNSSSVSFTAEQTLTLEPGTYSFSLFAQGGDMGDSQNCYAYVSAGGSTYTDGFTLTGWCVWAEPAVTFTLTETDSVTVGVQVTASQDGAWGTVDDWYLCKAATVHTHSYTESVTTDPTCESAGVKTYLCACGDSYTEAIPILEHSFVDCVCSVCGVLDLIDSGTCGEGITWTLLTNGKLTMSGTGSTNFDLIDNAPPWTDYLESIRTVVIEDGITNISSASFANCHNLTSVTIGNSVSSIDTLAFLQCWKLSSLFIPKNVESIHIWAFSMCSGLRTVCYEGSSAEWNSVLFDDGSGELDAVSFHFRTESVDASTPGAFQCAVCGEYYMDYSAWGIDAGEDGNYYLYVSGEVLDDFTGLYDNGIANWYIVNGQVQLSYTGLVTVDGERYYIKGGCVSDFAGLKKLDGSWLYLADGHVDTGYAGLVEHNGALAYVENGEVNFNKKDMVEYNGELYYVKYGLWSPGFTGMVKASDGVWRYVSGGKFAPTYTGLAKNDIGWWYVQNGLIDTTYTGLAAYNGTQYYIKWGQVMLSTTGVIDIKGTKYYIKGGAWQSSVSGTYTDADGVIWTIVDGIAQ